MTLGGNILRIALCLGFFLLHFGDPAFAGLRVIRDRTAPRPSAFCDDFARHYQNLAQSARVSAGRVIQFGIEEMDSPAFEIDEKGRSLKSPIEIYAITQGMALRSEAPYLKCFVDPGYKVPSSEEAFLKMMDTVDACLSKVKCEEDLLPPDDFIQKRVLVFVNSAKFQERNQAERDLFEYCQSIGTDAERDNRIRMMKGAYVEAVQRRYPAEVRTRIKSAVVRCEQAQLDLQSHDKKRAGH